MIKIKTAPAESALAKQSTTSISKATRHKPLVLLAEDDESVARSIERYLSFNSYRIIPAGDGATALQKAQQHQPDILLMDIQMPRLNGLEAIRRIRSTTDLKDTPIIALTGMTSEADEKQCMDAGANKFLSKPYRMKTLVDLIDELTRRNNHCLPDTAI